MPAKKQLKAGNEENSFDAIYRRCNKKNATKEDRAAFRVYLDNNPEAWRASTDMLHQAQLQLIEKTDCTSVMKELISFGCEQLKHELTQEGDGALERILIDAAVFAWLRLSFIEQHYTSTFNTSGRITLECGIFWEKRLNAAHKRFEAACVNLARVRKLLSPGVKNLLSVGQINAFLNTNSEERSLNPCEMVADTAIRGLSQKETLGKKAK